ncbi:hypothetical protein ABK040_009376 [Willaertia magna]
MSEQPTMDEINEKKRKQDDSTVEPTEKKVKTEPNGNTTTSSGDKKKALINKLKQQATQMDILINNSSSPTTNGRKKSEVSTPTDPITPTRSKRTRRPNKYISQSTPTLPEKIQKKLLKLITSLKKHEWAWPFNQPVDPIQLHIPDYFDIIKNPMDLGTVEKKLKNEAYSTIEHFLDDVRLIWSNCYTYNNIESDVAIMCMHVEKAFIEKFNKLSAELNISEIHIPTVNNTSPTVTPTPPIIETVKEPPVEKEKTPAPSKKKSTTPTSARGRKKKTPSKETTTKTKEEKKPTPSMSYVEKKLLSENISKLNGENLQTVINIVQNRAPKASSNTGESEIEVDLDKLDYETLRELEAFVSTQLTSTTPTPVASASNSTEEKETPKKKKKTTATNKKKKKTSKDKKIKKKEDKEEDIESSSSATDNSGSEESASETDSSETDSNSDSDSDNEVLNNNKNNNHTKEQNMSEVTPNNNSSCEIIPAKKPVEKIAVDELNWNSLLEEEEDKKIKTHEALHPISEEEKGGASLKWCEFKKQQKRQNEMEEKMKQFKKQKEEEKRQQQMAVQYSLNERELAKRQREEGTQNKMHDEFDEETFEKELFN